MAVLTLVVLAGCGFSAIRGSGTLKIEPRPVVAFREVSLASIVDAEIAPGAAAQVELTGDDNLLPLITTEVRGDRLVIATAQGVNLRPSQRLKARIFVPALRAVDVSGTSNVQLTGVEAEALRISISGTSNMQLASVATGALAFSISGTGKVQLTDVGTTTLAISVIGTGAVAGIGRAGHVDVDVSGTGRLELAQLPVDDAKIDVSGTGNIEVTVTRALEALVSGTGAIVYNGEPSVRSKITGTGDIRHK